MEKEQVTVLLLLIIKNPFYCLVIIVCAIFVAMSMTFYAQLFIIHNSKDKKAVRARNNNYLSFLAHFKILVILYTY